MWIFTKYGFYSVTVSRVDPRKMQIRARAREDLDWLIKFSTLGTGDTTIAKSLGPIIETPDADYRYRLLCPQWAWVELAKELAKDVDYSNFKNTISDPSRHKLYERVWGIMQSLQVKRAQEERQYRLFPQANRLFNDAAEINSELEAIERRVAELEDVVTEEDLPSWVGEEIKGELDPEDDPSSPFYDPGRKLNQFGREEVRKPDDDDDF